ncbi:MAG: hypothetical protein OXI74_19490 [Rhodospirillaceae bacterium]|nr:hypothetical protein [Rhodospirillaceae bacterium]
MLRFDPSDISNWADRPDAIHQLPELIRRLILGTAPSLSRLDIPSGSAVWLPGGDGLLAVEAGNAWVPDGSSAWEFGSGKDPASKANGDYRKRTDDPEGVDVANATFVFVTPRQWRGKCEWVERRRAEHKWADVRAFDGSDLAAWLEQAPAVAGWFARLIGKLPDEGYAILTEWWENWSTVSASNSISPALVLAGRQEDADSISDWAIQAPSHFYVRGGTQEEAIAFLAACALNSDDEWGATLLSRALVVKTVDAWTALVGNTSPLVLIRDFDADVSPLMATNRGHHVVTPLHINANTGDNGITLNRLGRDETTPALVEMGLSETRARALTRKTARKLPIMRRFLLEEAGGPIPGWASLDAGKTLAPLILVGQWDEDNENDKAVVSKITGRPYEEVARDTTALMRGDDSPMTKVGSQWRFFSHEEAWHLLAPRLTADEVQRFEEAATDILGVESPEFELPIEKRHLANIHGKVLPHSETLRAGIARTLGLMGTQGDRADHVQAVSYLPALIVLRVLLDRDGWQIWASLEKHLATLAEAAPETLLDAIEQSLSAQPDSTAALFAQEGGPFFGGASHTGLLWTLERLAWSPGHFARVAMILARLAALDPGGRISNRPSESLATMFLSWFRVSEASDDQRLETLDTLLRRFSAQGWKTLVGAYPSRFATVIGREPPNWRPWGQDGVPHPNWSERYVFAEGLGRLLLQHVGADAGRWTDVLGILSNMSAGTRQKAIELLAQRVDVVRQHPESPNLWATLRSELNQHLSFPDAEWAMAITDLEPLAEIYQALAPVDPAKAYAWLFDNWPKPPEGTDHEASFEEQCASIDAARQSAVAAAYENGRTEAILSIAESAKQPEEVGRAFALVIGTNTALDLSLEHVGSDQNNFRMMARGILWTVFRQSGWPRLEGALEQARAADAGPLALADIYLAASLDEETWRRLDHERLEIQQSYWQLMEPWRVSREDGSAISFVVRHLLAVRRSPTVAEWIAHQQADHEIVLQTLEQLPFDLVAGATEELRSGGFGYSIDKLFGKLDESDMVDDDTIARLEIPFLNSLLWGSRANLALYREISRNPSLFADVIASACKRDDGQGNDLPSEQETQVATAIISQITFGKGVIPGRTEDGTVDYETLSAWVNEARRLCGERGRGSIGDEFIGQLLAKAPAGEDGVWPCEPVRELLDSTMVPAIGIGFDVGTHNLRGVTSRGAFDGGDQERTLADKYAEWALAIASKWPHTAGLLWRIAESYQHEAQRIDQEADRLDQFGF